MKKFLLPLLAVSFLFGIAPFSIANAQQGQGQIQCNERGEVLTLLAKKYKEAPIGGGVTSKGALIELFNDPNSGTWTLILTSPKKTPDGSKISCLIAAGEGWRVIEYVIESDGQDS